MTDRATSINLPKQCMQDINRHVTMPMPMPQTDQVVLSFMPLTMSMSLPMLRSTSKTAGSPEADQTASKAKFQSKANREACLAKLQPKANRASFQPSFSLDQMDPLTENIILQVCFVPTVCLFHTWHRSILVFC